MSAPRILVVDDEADLRELLEITLLKMGLDVDTAEDLKQARALLDRNSYALVLTDMRLPDGLGLDLVREVAGRFKNTPIAVITAFGSADNAVLALKLGAFDYICKPVGLEPLRLMVQSALRLPQARPAPGSFEALGPPASTRLTGISEAMQSLRAQIARLARSMAPIAISGESGSGKELAAREIHAQSARAGQPFIAVNCGAIPETLMEAEFFGYRKGAFTGANDERDGFFQAAHGGTLLLDEVADLPLAMQVKLLRAIQERRVRKLGATTEEAVDVRIISATHQDLAACVERGSFRQDLFYRLNVIELALPPLRDRLDDLPLLSNAILERLAAGGPRARLAPQALPALQAYHFPGNVRELENILERAVAYANDGIIEASDLFMKPARAGAAPAAAADPLPPATAVAAAVPSAPLAGNAFLPPCLPDYLIEVERDIILRALAQTQFNRTQAAQLLGISLRQLRYQMQKLEITTPEG